MARKSPYQHDAGRDTQWVGKGVAQPWLVVLAIVALAAIAVVVFR
jgi:hypothetical protein